MKTSNIFGSQKINTSKSLLKNQAYDLLKNAIINNHINPDTIYSQESLSQSLGISRTPVREALLQLQNEGIIQIHRGRGIQIINTTIYDIKDILELSDAIGTKVIQLAVERIDEHNLAKLSDICNEMNKKASAKRISQFMEIDHKFHITLTNATGNKKFIENIEMIHQQLLRSRLVYDVASLPEIVSEHNDIILALKKRSFQESVQAMYNHLKNNYFRIMNFYEKENSIV